MRIKSFMPGIYVGMAAAAVGALGLSGTFVYLARQDGRDTWLVYFVMAPFLLTGLLLAFFGLRRLSVHVPSRLVTEEPVFALPVR